MRILGIDPGVGITGWGVIEGAENSYGGNGFEVVDYGVIKTPVRSYLPRRLVQIYEEMNNIIREYDPGYASVEKLFFCRNITTAMSVGEARGVVMMALEQANLSIKEFTPLQIKEAVCGYGKANKRQVQLMVTSILGMDKIPSPDDAADGLAAAICGIGSINLDSKLSEIEE